jgi:hypothetical protein
MRQIAAIRTHKWGEEEDVLYRRLAPVFGSDLVVVFHDRPRGVIPPLLVIDIDSGWVENQGLAAVPDWGWRCGDYFLYALRQARPDSDAYWIVEPDVFFSADPTPFFRAFDGETTDALGYNLAPYVRQTRFTDGLPGISHYQAIFALTRFTGRALDRLLPLRQALSARMVSEKTFPNDELFCFSHAAADPGLTTGRLEDTCPDWFKGVQFTPDPDLIRDLVEESVPSGRVVHPVRSRSDFVRAVARRFANHTGVFLRMREQLAALTDAEVDALVAEVAALTRAAIEVRRGSRPVRRAGATR